MHAYLSHIYMHDDSPSKCNSVPASCACSKLVHAAVACCYHSLRLQEDLAAAVAGPLVLRNCSVHALQWEDLVRRRRLQHALELQQCY